MLMSEYFTPDDLAKKFQIPRQMVIRRVATHQWPCLRLSSHTIRFTPAHIEQIEQITKIEISSGLPLRRIGRRASF